jgi:thioredoxin 2
MELVCPGCSAVNRVPDERLGDRPKCGKCGAQLLPGVPIDLTVSSFDRLIGRGGLPALVDFWASWCGPCKAMAPVFAQVAADLSTRFVFAKVNTEQEQQIAARHGIRSIPSLVLFKGGREVDRMAGAMEATGLRLWLARH